MMNQTKLIADEIAPHVEAIKLACVKNGIPFFFSIAAEDDGKTTKYISEILSPKISGTQLTEDRITNMLNVANGFNTVPPMYESVIDF